MGVFAGPEIVEDGLVLALDAGNTKSYPGSGTTWTDLSGNGNNGSLVNGVGYNSGNLGSLSFDGVNDYVNFGNIFNDVFAGVDKKYTHELIDKLFKILRLDEFPQST